MAPDTTLTRPAKVSMCYSCRGSSSGVKIICQALLEKCDVAIELCIACFNSLFLSVYCKNAQFYLIDIFGAAEVDISYAH